MEFYKLAMWERLLWHSTLNSATYHDENIKFLKFYGYIIGSESVNCDILLGALCIL
jgi:hypothetical protein